MLMSIRPHISGPVFYSWRHRFCDLIGTTVCGRGMSNFLMIRGIIRFHVIVIQVDTQCLGSRLVCGAQVIKRRGPAVKLCRGGNYPGL